MDQEAWKQIKDFIDWLFKTDSFASLKQIVAGTTKGSLRTGTAGHNFEHVFASMCRERNLFVLEIGHKQASYDLLVNTKRVQCKFLGGGRTDIAPRSKDENGVRAYPETAFDVLAVQWCSEDEIYIIPVCMLREGNGYLKTRFTPQLFPSCKNNWAVFEKNFEHYRQRNLFVL